MSAVRHVDGPTISHFFLKIFVIFLRTKYGSLCSCILISNLFFHRSHGNVKQVSPQPISSHAVPIAATRVTPAERYSDIIDSHDILERYIRRKLPKYQIKPVPGNGKCIILAMQTCLENCGIVHDVETIKNRLLKYLLVWKFTKVFAWRIMVRR